MPNRPRRKPRVGCSRVSSPRGPPAGTIASMDMDRTPPLAIAIPVTISADVVGHEQWERWKQRGREHDRLMVERWRELATVMLVGSLLTAATILALR